MITNPRSGHAFQLPLAQDRIVRKESALGQIREIPPPMGHIGLTLAPWKEVPSDDVMFSFIPPESTGIAPARAEDAESELADKDDFVGIGRASLIDWALKDHYKTSDISRYREYLAVHAQMAAAGGAFPLFMNSMLEDFPAKVARDTKLRKAKLDNRIEWLIMTGLVAGLITYNDGKIKFSVDYGRPANQTDEATASGQLWSSTTADPIGDFKAVDEFMYSTYYVRMGTVIGSRRAWYNLTNSDRWAARSGLAGATGGKPVDPNYLISDWGPAAARRVFEMQTGLKTIEYDAVYATRAMGSTTTTYTRFMPDDTLLFLPAPEYISQVDDGEVGFARTLTSPHVEGNWTPGFYEWETPEQQDPWGKDIGSGIKAFPVFPHLNLTYTMKVL